MQQIWNHPLFTNRLIVIYSVSLTALILFFFIALDSQSTNNKTIEMTLPEKSVLNKKEIQLRNLFNALQAMDQEYLLNADSGNCIKQYPPLFPKRYRNKQTRFGFLWTAIRGREP